MLFLAIFLTACAVEGPESAIPPAAQLVETAPAAPPPSQEESKPELLIETESEAARFLIRSGFGGSADEIDALVGSIKTDWIRSQISQPKTEYLSEILSLNGNPNTLLGQSPHSAIFMRAGIEGNDQLRQRMVFALSQILVVSDNGSGGQMNSMGYYLDLLSEHAFGNYRDLLEEITYSPAMGEYLTYVQNEKGDPRSGRMPDENYAREILQLFTIGLVELELDGTPKIGPDGRHVETYTNNDVVGLAKVFTGLSLKGPTFRKVNADHDAQYSRLKAFPDRHSIQEKSFLGTTIPAGTGVEESIDLALDHLFEHPNVAPFVSRQLIQRFTASNPSPDYVERVAIAFNAGSYVADDGSEFGTGVRGDLEATIAAVLLDPSVGEIEQTSGKIREPVLKFIQWARVFDVGNLDFSNERPLVSTASATNSLGQHAFRSPSVFNFYRPGYIAPGTQSGDAGLTAPEFQLINEGSVVGYINFMYDYAIDRTGVRNGAVSSFLPDYAAEYELMEKPADLVDRLDLLLTGKTLSNETRASVLEAISAMPISENNPERDYKDRLAVAITMITASPAYAVVF